MKDTVKLSVYLDPDDIKKVKKKCKKVGLSNSAYLRTLILEEINK